MTHTFTKEEVKHVLPKATDFDGYSYNHHGYSSNRVQV